MKTRVPPIAILALLLALSARPAARADAPEAAASFAPTAAPALTVSPALRKNVDFWIAINTRYYTYQGLIHDAKYIDHVYQVLDLRGAPKGGSRLIRAAKHKWREVLLSLHRKQQHPESWPASLTEDEKRVAQLFDDIHEPNKFLNAAHRKRLRFQLGQREHYLEGLVQSGRYLPLMEDVFRREGLPVELTRLPFVESSFNLRARSKVGASGIWQFMRSTARLFIQVNDAVDERNDPIRATEAAARLLKLNYDSLGSWPLAVTAYNHGRKGMMRAVRRVGSDELGDLVADYHSRTFGFASSNFFAELLACVEIEKNADQYFGPVARLKPLDAVEVTIPDFVSLRELGRFLKLDLAALRELNPALSEDVFGGRALVPAGYKLRLPADPTLARDAQARVFLAGYSQIPDLYKLRAQKGATRARRGPKRQSM